MKEKEKKYLDTLLSNDKYIKIFKSGLIDQDNYDLLFKVIYRDLKFKFLRNYLIGIIIVVAISLYMGISGDLPWPTLGMAGIFMVLVSALILFLRMYFIKKKVTRLLKRYIDLHI